ncbi:hypothetical protein [Bradyrhizobium sp. CCBAU 53421]|uniref:hypothetical protein n=1 Tax=Bradyrhizobium sp. CCBAU 53421 TaxID=1325120 RepID=UPI00188AC51A|nr:hypothetical protein [Bradyrhizobium sp. CCBAU 53421]QOZ33214.1 hypothetical protein XH92_17315 [Bradyrhizobium sp. CCBAU 53421]
MKKIIGGIAYDTDTAECLTRSDHQHEMSQAWWSLYRTRQGAFFEVAADHDGVVDTYRPVSKEEARRYLERHANHLVERYFGPVPEAGPKRFSRRTVFAAVQVLNRLTHAEFTRFLFELGPDWPKMISPEPLSLAKRLNELMGVYDQNPDRLVEDGESLDDVLVEKAVSLLPAERRRLWSGEEEELREDHRDFLHRLEIDGFVVADGKLRTALPRSIALPEAQDELSALLLKHRFTVAQGHLDQAFSAHTSGNWAAANAQIRSFLDGLLDEIAERLDPSAAALGSGNQRRARLAALGFLSRDLNEWSDNGQGYLNGLIKRLHPHGSHPGLSDADDCTFRLHTVLLAARLFLVRFDKWDSA